MVSKCFSRKWIYAALVLLLLPLIESLLPGSLGGLQLQSPQDMAVLGYYLRPVKFLMVVMALALWLKMERRDLGLLNKTTHALFIYSGYLLAAVQLAFLGLGILLSGLVVRGLTPPPDIHRQQTFAEHTIYAYTADPGAMGKAYHHFYLVCPAPFHRYTLKKIAKLDWMRTFSFVVHDNVLEVHHKNYKGEEGEPHYFELSPEDC